MSLETVQTVLSWFKPNRRREIREDRKHLEARAAAITQPALATSPQPRPAPTRRTLLSKPAARRGQNWTPMRGQI